MQCVCHGKSKGWLLTSLGSSTSNGTEIGILLEAVRLPRKIAVLHCPACTKGSSQVTVVICQTQQLKLLPTNLYMSVLS